MAPAGYHIPTNAEWTVLTNYLDGEDVAGKKMKSTSGWSQNRNGTDSSGFSGLPGGGRDYNGAFFTIGESGYWWSSSEYNTTQAWGRGLVNLFGNVARGTTSKGEGLSVRCLRD